MNLRIFQRGWHFIHMKKLGMWQRKGRRSKSKKWAIFQMQCIFLLPSLKKKKKARNVGEPPDILILYAKHSSRSAWPTERQNQTGMHLSMYIPTKQTLVPSPCSFGWKVTPNLLDVCVCDSINIILAQKQHHICYRIFVLITKSPFSCWSLYLEVAFVKPVQLARL